MTLSIKNTVRKLHAMLNNEEQQQQQEEWMNVIDENRRHNQEQLAVALDEKTMSVAIHDLTNAVEEENMQALRSHTDNIAKGLRNSIASLHFAFEGQDEGADTAGELGKRLLELLHDDDGFSRQQTTQERIHALANSVAVMGGDPGDPLATCSGPIEEWGPNCFLFFGLFGLFIVIFIPLFILLLPIIIPLSIIGWLQCQLCPITGGESDFCLDCPDKFS